MRNKSLLQRLGVLICVVMVLFLVDHRLRSNKGIESAELGQARGGSAVLELDTVYVPPPGDQLEHHTAGFAKILCSAVFVSGLDEEFAADNLGFFTSPFRARAKVVERVVDRENREVRLTLGSGVVRTAKYLGDQGCVTVPTGTRELNFTPVEVNSALPNPSTTPWPMGLSLIHI